MIRQVVVLVAASLLPVYSMSRGCDAGRFGPNCQYDCHCQNLCNICDGNKLCVSCEADGACSSSEPDCPEDNCDRDGRCINGAGCRKGWFGPSCQYVDLIQTEAGVVRADPGSNNVTTTLSDGNDTSCLTNPGLQSITVTWTQQYPFTWLRAHAGNAGANLLQSITIKFSNSTSSALVSCTSHQSAMVSETILDIHCDLNVSMSQVILTGPGVGNLCSLYINGGRNIALRQRTAQSSTINDEFSADKAVEGDRNGYFDNTNYVACTHTASSQILANWNVTLSHQQYINRYVLYNRAECCRWRLKGFILTSYNSSGDPVFGYTDKESNTQLAYSVISVSEKLPVSAVRVEAVEQRGEIILTLCEVELFGDSACEGGKYGRDCDHDCNCAVQDETCFVSTGGCPSGCAAGFHGEDCHSGCQPTRYGINCLENCSSNCWNKTCDSVTGKCLQCVAGKRGNYCDIGQKDSNACSEHCAGGAVCDGVNGGCLNGCQPGYVPPICNTKCPNKKYGLNCSLTCSDRCIVNETTEPAVCDHVTGLCLLGCVNDDCPSQEALGDSGGSSEEDDTTLIVGVVVAAAVVLAVVGVIGGVMMFRKRSQPSRTDHLQTSEVTEDELIFSVTSGRKYVKKHDDIVGSKAEEPSSDGYYNQVGSQLAISAAGLGVFLASHDIDFFKNQFEKVPGILTKYTMDVGLSKQNKHKNLYKNICAYDHSSVHLEINRDRHEGDYINASYVEGHDNVKFIASQGPNQALSGDFIRMLWEQRPDIVVMLTNLTEDGKSICDQYWPDERQTTFGEITVQLQTTQVFADFTERKLRLIKGKHSSHDLTHFHFTSWPDEGVPDTPWPLVDFEQQVASIPTTRPIVVHCSDGVGRTGVFIALRDLLKEAESKGTVNFYSTLVKLRNARVYMIQTLEQYVFLHKAVHVAVACLGTAVTQNSISDRIDNLNSVSPTERTHFEEEYEAMCNVCDGHKMLSHMDQKKCTGQDNVCQNSHIAENKVKNRFNNVLPNNNFRPVLKIDLKNEGDYINAVLVPGFQKLDNQILTQLPMPATLLDFWRLVIQYKITLIVAFEVDERSKDKTIGHYLPSTENEPITAGPFDVQSGPTNHNSFGHEQKLTISTNDQYSSMSVNGSSEKQKFYIIHLKCTRPDTEPKSLLDLVERVRTLKGSEERRTLYMCRNGALYSGLVYILTLLLDRLDSDHRLTVPLVVGTVKYIRPQVIPTLEQYKLLYEVLKHYRERNGTYRSDEDTNLDIHRRPLTDEDSAYIDVVMEDYHVYEEVDKE